MSNARRIRWVVIVVLLGLAAWFVGTHVGQWKDRFVPRRFRVVELGKIYASGQINQHLIRQVLSQYGIKVIVCLDNDDNSDSDVVAEQTAARDLGIDREIFPLSGDGTGDIHSYANALARIVAANKENVPVLVHCSSGAQRTNGTVGFYRILIQHRDPNDTADEMIRNGHDPHKNPLLIPYMNEHMGELAQLLVEMGVLDAIPSPVPQINPR